MIVKSQLTDDQCHPEEGVYITVTDEVWKHHMTQEGVVEDDYQLRKVAKFNQYLNVLDNVLMRKHTYIYQNPYCITIIRKIGSIIKMTILL